MNNSSTLGWSLVIAASLFILLVSGLIFYVGVNEDSTRTVLRFTSVTSALPFLLVFLSKPLSYFQRTQEFSQGTRDNRRYLWLTLTASHLVHLYAIFVFFQLKVKEIPGSVLWMGGIAYAIILIFGGIELVKPSLFDEARNSQSNSFINWIYGSGIWYVWLLFFLTYLGSATGLSALAQGRQMFYTIPGAIVFLAAALFRLIVKFQGWKLEGESTTSVGFNK